MTRVLLIASSPSLPQASNFHAKFPGASDLALDLLTRLLTFDPAKRVDVGHVTHPCALGPVQRS
jgi:hypothetical protein